MKDQPAVPGNLLKGLTLRVHEHGMTWLHIRSVRLCAGGEERQSAAGDAHGKDVVDERRRVLQDKEADENDNGQVDGVVVEDGEGGGLVVGYLVLLPQDALVLFLARDLLVIAHLTVDLAGHRLLPPSGDLVLQLELDVLVGGGHQISTSGRHQDEQDGAGPQVHVVDAPEEPCKEHTPFIHKVSQNIQRVTLLTDWNGRHDKGIAVEQRRRLGAHVAAKVLQQQLLFLGEARGLDFLLFAGSHFSVRFS